MTGLRFNEGLSRIHFWTMFTSFNSTFGPLFAAVLTGMPRRVSTYSSSLEPLNIWVSVSAFDGRERLGVKGATDDVHHPLPGQDRRGAAWPRSESSLREAL